MAVNFFKQSFWIPQPSLTEHNLEDQIGKVFIVTGGYSGIGLELCKILYGRNGTVYLAGRNEEEGNRALRSLETEYPNSKGKAVFFHLDLNDLSTIKKSADNFLACETRLDVLTNNAGVVQPNGLVTTQGHEIHLGTNCLGPFLFTHYLTPILCQTAASSPPGSVRITWAASLSVDFLAPTGGVEFDDIGSPKTHRDHRANYAQSKVGNIFLAKEFATELSKCGVINVAFNPGNLRTNIQKHFSKTRASLFDWLLYPPIYGAYTELYCACSSEITLKQNGCYVIPWGRISSFRKDIEEACVSESEGGTGHAQRFLKWCRESTEKFV